MRASVAVGGVFLGLGLWNCGGGAQVGAPSLPDAQVVGRAIVARGGGPLEMRVGDALPLQVVEQLSDGSLRPLADEVRVSWTSPQTVVARAYDDDVPVFPRQTDAPTAIFVSNPLRSDHQRDLSGVLFALDSGLGQGGAVTVVAQVEGFGPISAQVQVADTPPGDPIRGSELYGINGFNCGSCHGGSGHGPDATTRSSGGVSAPGLNDEPGNVASDPAWSAALLALAAQADLDNAGVALRAPMPDFLQLQAPDGHTLTGQDAADLYAFLQSQTD